jgi:lambda family phage portal protein
VSELYTAAAQGRRTRMWRASSAGPNAVNLAGIGTIRARARDQVRNNPWGTAAVDRLTSNGIATGIQCKGLWGDEGHRKRETRLWKRFVRSCDADGVNDWYGLQALAWREWKEAGEVFVRLRARRESDGLPVPLQLQLVASEQCPNELYTTASNGNPVRAGIEFDLIGRRVAYWMYREHPGDYSGTVNGHELVRVPADQVLHVYQPKRAGQLRGLPDITPALMRMFNLDRYADNVLERQAIANLFLGFYTQKAEPEDPQDAGGAGAPIGDGAEPGADGIQLAGMEPATMQELPPGMDVKFSSPPDAGANYGDYMRNGLMEIAATVGVPVEVLTGDLRNISDRALRLILNEFRRLIEMWQWLTFIPMFCQPVRQAYLDAAVLGGALEVDGYADVRDDVADTLWVPQGWPYSHPVQDVDADLKAIRGGLASRSGTVLGRGEDPEQIDAEIAADNARADAHGFVLDSDPRRTSAAGLTQKPPPADDTSTGDTQ